MPSFKEPQENFEILSPRELPQCTFNRTFLPDW